VRDKLRLRQLIMLLWLS